MDAPVEVLHSETNTRCTDVGWDTQESQNTV